jgi:hypothetical protein
MKLKSFIHILLLLLFSACQTETISAKDKMLGKEKDFSIVVKSMLRTSKSLVQPIATQYKIKIWEKQLDGNWVIKYGASKFRDMDFLDDYFQISLPLVYGNYYKASIIGFDKYGKEVSANPNIYFRADVSNKIEVSLYRLNGRIYSLDIMNFNPILFGESFTMKPKIIFPFSDIEKDFSISLTRVYSNTEEFFVNINKYNLDVYTADVEFDKYFSINSNSEENVFLFEALSPYDDISSYGELFSVQKQIDENGTATLQIQPIDLMKDYSIKQTPEEIEITIFFQNLEGVDIFVDGSRVEAVEESEEKAIFRFSPLEFPDKQFDFRLRGELQSGKSYLSYYSIYLDTKISKYNLVEE